ALQGCCASDGRELSSVLHRRDQEQPRPTSGIQGVQVSPNCKRSIDPSRPVQRKYLTPSPLSLLTDGILQTKRYLISCAKAVISSTVTAPGRPAYTAPSPSPTRTLSLSTTSPASY